jgi:hypothetical protein
MEPDRFQLTTGRRGEVALSRSPPLLYSAQRSKSFALLSYRQAKPGSKSPKTAAIGKERRGAPYQLLQAVSSLPKQQVKIAGAKQPKEKSGSKKETVNGVGLASFAEAKFERDADGMNLFKSYPGSLEIPDDGCGQKTEDDTSEDLPSNKRNFDQTPAHCYRSSES